MLALADSWVWDLWLVDDGARFHIFFLYASRALKDPDKRHFHAGVGHAVSEDLASWTRVSDALVHDEEPSFDDLAIWTGSIVRGGTGEWLLFYTGSSRAEAGLVQRIGLARSSDLFTWERVGGGPLLEADGRWYEKLSDRSWPDEAWRDPWVFPDPGGDGWHMLITARSKVGEARGRGVIGHARSSDLLHWQAQPPLSAPGAGFGQLEVPQVEMFDDGPGIIFSCLGSELTDGVPGTGGIWVAPAESLTGPFDLGKARLLTDESLYSGRAIRNRSGRWILLAFENRDSDGHFVGAICDPLLLSAGTDGIPVLDVELARARR
ncbi:MAG: hypothetical protein JWM85_2219, partial [Acidimicrobiaceae bacterium]|nr:hypothetical protein [Acidimicrobiaceae bacterium]